MMDKILVADDDPALRGLLKLVARRVGFEVDTAADGREALEKIRANDYLIAIVDLMMPVMDGYEVVDALAEIKNRPGVIVVTAMTDTYVQRLDGQVVQSIIRKPFDIEMMGSILTELARALRKARHPDNVIDLRDHAR